MRLKTKKRSGSAALERTFHAKAVLGVENARLKFHDDLPEAQRTGFARPGAEYPVTRRLERTATATAPPWPLGHESSPEDPVRAARAVG
ncbi:hypothetical protein [Streptomyces sp. AP-93]|uniref:hypothetical protein n=1 Tax=Streptomyces sp. AP-93 TaxID=2929048 RepID=UPI001FAE8E6D|nr:hypothetical protein [Streptomyces sp. AP-93]MCJ0875151.1 hypothetical protein [Streptomyces sp. AP-93]